MMQNIWWHVAYQQIYKVVQFQEGNESYTNAVLIRPNAYMKWRKYRLSCYYINNQMEQKIISKLFQKLFYLSILVPMEKDQTYYI